METVRGLAKLVFFGVVLPTGAMALGISINFFSFLGGGPSVLVAGVLLGSVVCAGVLTLISGAMQLRAVHGRERARLVALVVIGALPMVFLIAQNLTSRTRLVLH